MLRTAFNSVNKRIVSLNCDLLISNNLNCYRKCSTACWKCGNPNNIANIFCSSCSAIQKPTDTKNFFQIFDFPIHYNVDKKILTKKYRNLQSQLHPDKFSNKSNEEKDISQEYSSLLNKAYSTLSIPMSRALHMLLLNGHVIDESDKIEDAAFLMEMMDLNEEIDDADDEATLRLLRNKNVAEINDIYYRQVANQPMLFCLYILAIFTLVFIPCQGEQPSNYSYIIIMSNKGSLLTFVKSIYNDEFRWSMLKSVGFFAIGITIAKECAGMELIPTTA